MNLIFDIGNSRTKIALFEESEVVDCATYDSRHTAPIELEAYVDTLCRHYPVGDCMASVVGTAPQWERLLPAAILPRLQILSSHTPIPIINDYASPDTLGADRLAVVCGARSRCHQGAVLVIDAGTCITVDYLDAGNVYRGGAILPGLTMKFKALNTFTAKLPLVDSESLFQRKYNGEVEALEFKNPLIGRSTQECMVSGVFNATLLELDGFCQQILSMANGQPLSVMITGGDASLLCGQMKTPVSRFPLLLLEGLNNILEHNREQ